MAIDNTHTKYLKGSDKKAWNNYKEAYEAQSKFESFLSGFDTKNLGEGRQDIPLNKKNKKTTKK